MESVTYEQGTFSDLADVLRWRVEHGYQSAVHLGSSQVITVAGRPVRVQFVRRKVQQVGEKMFARYDGKLREVVVMIRLMKFEGDATVYRSARLQFAKMEG